MGAFATLKVRLGAKEAVVRYRVVCSLISLKSFVSITTVANYTSVSISWRLGSCYLTTATLPCNRVRVKKKSSLYN